MINLYRTLSSTIKQPHFATDAALITIMAVLAGCGLIYEYLLSHYAGRILGAMETTLFAMIGIMIVAMGLGSLAARKITCPFTGFAWIEILIAVGGTLSVLIISAMFAFSQLLPTLLAHWYGLPDELTPRGSFVAIVQKFAHIVPYLIGFSLGFLIGMEIPLIARVRQHLHAQHLVHNTGTIYGADYIGAGIGAALWVLFLLTMDITTAAALTASVNLLACVAFYLLYQQRIRYRSLLFIAQLAMAVLILLVFKYGSPWETTLEELLYKDKVIHSMHTPYQHLTITQRQMATAKPPIYTLYINGRTQFSSDDEPIYHEFLVFPAFIAAARQQHVLLIGGGDGLALRDILKWNPKTVTVLELDNHIVDFFSEPFYKNGKIINHDLLTLNQYAFKDPRVTLHYGDAFVTVNHLLDNQQLFDIILVDLPDPSHPDLNKLYSALFYSKLKHLLSGDGSIAIQSTSPYHARQAFISIGKTVKQAGFLHVEQYHQNIPSFGEWGWTIATLNGLSPKQRIQQTTQLTVPGQWITLPLLLASFEFPANFYANSHQISANRLGSKTVYQYHQQAWLIEQGLDLDN